MERNDFADRLFDAILTLQTREECYKFFGDACTPKEIQAIAQRFVVAQMLNEKKVYTEIIEKTGASTATISRINRCLKYGSDGYAEAIRRLDEKGIIPDETPEEDNTNE